MIINKYIINGSKFTDSKIYDIRLGFGWQNMFVDEILLE